MKSKNIQQNVDEYISNFSPDVQKKLHDLRELIKEVAPTAEEKISYQMPAFFQNGILVYFAAYKNHIGLYALPSGNIAFQKELSKYKTGKGSIQFPLDQPLPIKLISKIVKFRVQENYKKVRSKAKRPLSPT
jgi:uncharacterized protein YdhG (YjbR/CyaY superfamily)